LLWPPLVFQGSGRDATRSEHGWHSSRFRTARVQLHLVADKEQLMSLVAEAVFSGTLPLRLDDDGWEKRLRLHPIVHIGSDGAVSGRWSLLRRTTIDGVHSRRHISGPGVLQTDRIFLKACSPSLDLCPTYIRGRLSVEARLHGADDSFQRVQGLPSRDYVEFGVDAVVAGLRSLLMESPS
jgi:hypothetical protein